MKKTPCPYASIPCAFSNSANLNHLLNENMDPDISLKPSVSGTDYIFHIAQKNQPIIKT